MVLGILSYYARSSFLNLGEAKRKIGNKAMTKKLTKKNKPAFNDNALKSKPISNAQVDLVKHLARIAAERDYKKLLKSKNIAYDFDQSASQDPRSSDRRPHASTPRLSGEPTND